MPTLALTTRYVAATVDNGPLLRVYSSEGITVDFPWPDTVDTVADHEKAALKTALAPNPDRNVTLEYIEADALGHTFRAVFGLGH